MQCNEEETKRYFQSCAASRGDHILFSKKSYDLWIQKSQKRLSQRCVLRMIKVLSYKDEYAFKS